MTQLLTVGRFQALAKNAMFQLSSWKVFGELMWNLFFCAPGAPGFECPMISRILVHSMDRFSSKKVLTLTAPDGELCEVHWSISPDRWSGFRISILPGQLQQSLSTS